MYKYYNANFKGRKVMDCAIRAISLGTFKPWRNVYSELSDESRELGLMMDSVEAVETYLDKRYVRICYKNMTLEEFCNEYDQGIWIISMLGHLTCVMDGIVYDTFDPSSRFIKCAWRTK